jgi:uncharacterized cupredoxin-like copper-binding protein
MGGMKLQFTFGLAALLVLFAACPGTHREDYSHSGPSQGSQSVEKAQTPTDNSKVTNPVIPPQKDIPGARPTVANQTVEVQLTEYQINMPDTLPAGSVTFNVINAGKEDHSLAVEANGYHGELPEPLKRGDRHPLDVTLKPGTYNVYCPVDGHKGKGMARTLTVR